MEQDCQSVSEGKLVAGKQIVSAERKNLVYLLLRKLEKQSCFKLVLVSETQMSEDFLKLHLKKKSQLLKVVEQPGDLFLKGLLMINNEWDGLKKPIEMCVSSHLLIRMWSAWLLPCLWLPQRTGEEQRAAWEISGACGCGHPRALSREEAHSCSLSEVRTQRAFDRVSLCD